jgi:hypothetical protein
MYEYMGIPILKRLVLNIAPWSLLTYHIWHQSSFAQETAQGNFFKFF